MTDDQNQTTQRVAGPPRVVAGRYALLAEIGRGGMGVVWRGQDQVIGRQVAVKELRLSGNAEEMGVFQERVLREVRTGGKLNDPAVVTVYDVVNEGDTTFIVMELVDAPTLSDLIRERGPLPPAQVAAIGEQVLSALQAAHAAGIVHRDVKPGNIMVGANGRVKLTDFGIAQAVDDPRLTTSGMLVGSPAFMAPERVAGREAMPESDLWSLGATLFFAVEGMVAFERSTTAATLHAIMNEVPYLTHAQGPLASAIMGLLTAAPEGRITADQARGLLSMASSGTGQSTPPGGQTAVYQGNGGPNPTMVAGRTMLAGAPPAPAKGSRKGLIIGGVLAVIAALVGGFFLGKPVWGPDAKTDPAKGPTLTAGQGGDITTFKVSSSASSSSGSSAPSGETCLNTKLESGTTIDTKNWVDCDELHYAEWFGVDIAFGGSSDSSAVIAEYPDLDRLKRLAEAKCETMFYSNTIKKDKRAGLTYQAVVPTKDEWDRPHDSGSSRSRQFLCFVTSQDTRKSSAVEGKIN